MFVSFAGSIDGACRGVSDKSGLVFDIDIVFDDGWWIGFKLNTASRHAEVICLF